MQILFSTSSIISYACNHIINCKKNCCTSTSICISIILCTNSHNDVQNDDGICRSIYYSMSVTQHSMEFSKIFLLEYTIRRCAIQGTSFEAGPISACRIQFQYVYAYINYAVALSK